MSRLGASFLLGLALAVPGRPARAQGCEQCRESVGQTPLRTQAAYRHGISVLMVAAGGLCGAIILVARRYR